MTAETTKTNPDLQKERETASFNVNELTAVIYGGKENLERQRKLDALIFTNPEYRSVPLEFMSREEQYEEGIRRSIVAIRDKDAGVFDEVMKRPSDLHDINSKINNVNVLFDLNYGMFCPTIQSQGTPEQQEKFLYPALNHEIIGTYAQTEMGHGTFLRGLETTAHYDPNTQEFVLNTPTVTSTKWWPGALGKTSTHAVVMAQLYTQGKCRGIHPFVVQLRSLKDHTSMPGVEVGDIGPKFGYDANDNGYLRLNNVRIRRDNMLMRYSQVAPDGTYTKPPRKTLTYGTMTYVRSIIVKGCAFWLAQCCTIAIRYSAVRRQSEMRPGEPEPQVLAYQTQQHKLFPQLATAYAFIFVQMDMLDIFYRVTGQVDKGDFTRSQELHALSSCLKAYTSWTANYGAEVLRMSCGGHGYSHASGFPSMYAHWTPACTYEGENTVLMLQAARYLVKCARGEQSGSLPDSVRYLRRPPAASPHKRRVDDLAFLENCYRLRAYRLVRFATDQVESSLAGGGGSDLVGAMNANAVHLVRAATAHAHFYVVRNFNRKLDALAKAGCSRATIKTIRLLALLHALDGISRASGEFLEEDVLSASEVQKIRQTSIDLLPAIRPDCVALVDAFEFHDNKLNSVLGRYDGNVYENLLKWAQESPLNKTDVHHSSYDKYLKPLFNRNQSKL